MKIYRLNSNTNEELDLEKAIDYLQNSLHFKLETTFNLKDLVAQSEMITVLLEAYFIEDEIDENEDSWENDTRERELEYREVQGF